MPDNSPPKPRFERKMITTKNPKSGKMITVELEVQVLPPGYARNFTSWEGSPELTSFGFNIVEV